MKKLGRVFIGIVYAILYAPLLVMAVFSFNSAKSTTTFSGFSFRWYVNLFYDRSMRGILLNTLLISACAAVLATVLGVITGVSLMLLFTFFGTWFLHNSAILGFSTLLIAHITFNLPYVILNVLPRLYGSDVSLYEAAMDLGCTKTKAFWRIVFPGIVPGIVSGFIMAFTLSLDDFIISYYTNGHFNILATSLYTAVKKPLSPEYYALYTIIMLAIMLLLTAVNVIEIRSDRKNTTVKK